VFVTSQPPRSASTEAIIAMTVAEQLYPRWSELTRREKQAAHLIITEKVSQPLAEALAGTQLDPDEIRDLCLKVFDPDELRLEIAYALTGNPTRHPSGQR
jgi:hypothetical protein